MAEEKFTLTEALDVLMEMSNNVATLLGVANMDVADEFGEDAAEPREMFLTRRENGGDRSTVYARRLARMLVERMVADYEIAARPEPDATSPNRGNGGAE